MNQYKQFTDSAITNDIDPVKKLLMIITTKELSPNEIRNKLNSRNQKYRLTKKGQLILNS